MGIRVATSIVAAALMIAGAVHSEARQAASAAQAAASAAQARTAAATDVTKVLTVDIGSNDNAFLGGFRLW